MTIGDIIDYCCRTTGDISSEALDFARRAVRLKYATLYDAHAWRESLRVVDLTVDPNLGGAIFLPFDAEEVIFLSISYDSTFYNRLEYRERDWLERYGINIVTLPGNTPFYYRAENLAWPYFNPGKFTFTTSDRSSFTVYIEGRDSSNYPISESFIIAGIVNPDQTVTPASVTTQNSYALVTTLSKMTSSVPMTVAATGSPLFVMPPSINETVFTQLLLAPPPDFTNSDGSNRPVWVRVQIKLKPDTLDNDMSVPRISHIWDALIEFTLSSLYTKYRQLGKADAREQKAMAHIQAAVNVEKNQSEFRQQAIPIIYDAGDYRYPLVTRPTHYRPFG